MPIPKTTKQIIDQLVADKSLSAKQVEAALKELEQGSGLEQVLIKKGLIDEEALTKARAKVYGVPFRDIIGLDIVPEVLNIIPRETAETYRMVAFEKKGDEVSIGLVDPRDYQAIEAIEFLAEENKFQGKYFIISPTAFRKSLRRYEVLGKEVEKELEIAKERFAPKKEKMPEARPIEEEISGAPVARIVATITRHAVDSGASDIHIEPTDGPTRVRYRIDGALRTTIRLPKYIHAAVISRIKVMANLKIDETRIPQDGRFTEVIEGKKIDFRISTFPCAENEKVAMRILDTSTGAPTLETLGFSKEHAKIIQREISAPHGMVLITGPTGSGKSTTLYAILNMIKSDAVNIVTLEDPIEYFIEGVNQSQIRPEIDYSFVNGLRAILRQDPNIIMVGEIRDRETAELAIHAALTGHLLFSTIHTNDALGVVPRLIDMGAEPFLLASTLNAVVAQRLARRICEHCREVLTAPKDIEDEVREELKKVFKQALPAGVKTDGELTFYKGRGCARCNGSGYAGRISVAEIMMVDKDMERIIEAGFPSEQVDEAIKAQKMVKLRQDGFIKALQGLTTIEEVMRISEV
ncbi:GspE/PulE family protein [Patescibacteria group bacterium]|nr:GspE/PulE family protein [Patescibacteria group bacterium]MBU1921802.1 GspE/PulE family protein [Patescibacteria group bacterium]